MNNLSPSSSADFIPNYIRNIVVCPACRGDLHWGGGRARCENAANAGCPEYRIVANRPVLADEAAEPMSFNIEDAQHNKSRMKSFALRMLPSLDLNVVPTSAKTRLRHEIFALSDRPVVLNIGGKHPTSITEDLCSDANVDAIECDVAYRPRTRLFANPAKLPFRDASVDAVLLDGLLEHLPDPQAVADEAWRVLKPNGVIYSDTPFMLQVHGGAFDYMRFSHQAHRWLFRNFSELDSGVSSGPSVALAYAIQYFLLSFVYGQRIRYIVKTISRLFLFWIKYFDLVISKNPASRDAAFGLYFLGQKSNEKLGINELVRRYDGAVPDLYPPAK
jgi:SAM-dependent methyltransferase